MQGKYIRSVHTELLAIALALVIMAKNEYSTHFLASLSLRAHCDQNDGSVFCFKLLTIKNKKDETISIK